MSEKWSCSWKSSKEAAKQRKYLYNAPLHVKRKFLSANLSKTLRKNVGKKSISLRAGDEVIVKRGSQAGSTSEVTDVFVKKGTVYLKGIVRKKTDGTEAHIPIKPSNVQVISLNLDDPRRLGKSAAGKKVEVKPKKVKAETKTEDKPKKAEAEKKTEKKEEKKVEKKPAKKEVKKTIKKAEVKKPAAKGKKK